ncbi:MAG: alanine dehydrogenase [Bacteroidales bacterium]|nr:alanine dehydrogenase [Bacteroidales bacterium]
MSENNPQIRFAGSGELLPQEEMLETIWKKNSLTIGIPKESSPNENRIALVPDAVKLLTANDHRVFIERQAGAMSHFSDHEYAEAGAEIVDDKSRIFAADIVLKITPPTLDEIAMMEKRKTLFSILQLPLRNKAYFQQIINGKITALAFEHILDKSGGLPIKRSMSEIIGNATIMIASEYLCHPEYGKGIMLGGFPGLAPTEIVIIGAGTVAQFAARTALGMGAYVKVFDNAIYKLRDLQNILGGRLYTSILEPKLIDVAIRTADVVIAAKHTSSGIASCFITEDMVRSMKPGSVIIDVSIDQGGCFETSKPTSHQHPVFIKHGVTHYCVPNIASRVPHTASWSFSNFFAPLLIEAGEMGGIDNMLKANKPFSKGVYVYNGTLTNQEVSKLFHLPFQHLDLLLTTFY